MSEQNVASKEQAEQYIHKALLNGVLVMKDACKELNWSFPRIRSKAKTISRTLNGTFTKKERGVYFLQIDKTSNDTGTKNNSTESSSTESSSTESSSIESSSIESSSIESSSTESDSIESSNTGSDSTESDSTESDSTESDSTESDTNDTVFTLEDIEAIVTGSNSNKSGS